MHCCTDMGKHTFLIIFIVTHNTHKIMILGSKGSQCRGCCVGVLVLKEENARKHNRVINRMHTQVAVHACKSCAKSNFMYKYKNIYI